MNKLWEIVKKTLVILGYISSIITIFELIVNYKDLKTKLVGMINHFDFNYIGQLLQVLGLIIIISGIIIFIFLKIYNKYEPSRSVADIIAPLLLSKDVIGDKEQEFDKKLKLFRFIRIGVIIIIVGLVFLIIKLFN